MSSFQVFRFRERRRPYQGIYENWQCNGTMLNYLLSTHLDLLILGCWDVNNSGLSGLVRAHKDTPLKFQLPFNTEDYVLCCPWPEITPFNCAENSRRLISRPSFNLTELGAKKAQDCGPSSALSPWLIPASFAEKFRQLQCFFSSQDKYDATRK